MELGSRTSFMGWIWVLGHNKWQESPSFGVDLWSKHICYDEMQGAQKVWVKTRSGFWAGQKTTSAIAQWHWLDEHPWVFYYKLYIYYLSMYSIFLQVHDCHSWYWTSGINPERRSSCSGTLFQIWIRMFALFKKGGWQLFMFRLPVSYVWFGYVVCCLTRERSPGSTRYCISAFFQIVNPIFFIKTSVDSSKTKITRWKGVFRNFPAIAIVLCG